MGVADALVEVARCVVGWSAKESGERQKRVVMGVWHLLVATHTFLGEQVRQCATEASWTIFVMDVHHQVVAGTLQDSLMEPGRPLLTAHMDKTELHTTDAPLLIEGKQLIELTGKGTLIDIKPYPHPAFLGIATNFGNGKVALGGHPAGIALHPSLGTIPTRIEFHILQAHALAKVDAPQNVRAVKSSRAECFSRAHPRIVTLRWWSEVEQEVVVIDEFDRLFCRHNDAPRCVMGRDDIDIAIERNLQHIIFQKSELPTGVVAHIPLKESHKLAIRQLQKQGTLTIKPGLTQGTLVIRPLCPLFIPPLSACRQGKGGALTRKMQEKAIGGFREVIAQSHSFVIGTDNDVHRIELTFVIAIGKCAFAISFFVMKYELIVMVADGPPFTIEWRPEGIDGATFLTPQHEVGRPVVVLSPRHAQGRLKQTVVNVHTQ